MGLTGRQKQVYDSYHEHNCSPTKAARELGITVNAVKKTLYVCARNGFSVEPDGYCEQAPAGFTLDKTTIQINSEGEVVQRWDRVSPMVNNLPAITRMLEERIPVLATKIKAPKKPNKNLMLEWNIYDHHQGMHSWAKQTGADYDNKIAQDLIVRASEKIFSHVGQVSKSVIVLGGDNQHSDNRQGKTEKSGHFLDVDGRYPKTGECLYCGITTAIDNALVFSGEVYVIILSGNHDWHSAWWLSLVLRAHYRNNPRVKIDDSAAKHRFNRFGNNLFMYSHGDTGVKRWGQFMMSEVIRREITGVKRMFVRVGHLHKQGRTAPPELDEDAGVIVERFPTLAAPDSFAHEEAYISQRATVANLWHGKYGQRSRIELGVEELLEE